MDGRQRSERVPVDANRRQPAVAGVQTNAAIGGKRESGKLPSLHMATGESSPATRSRRRLGTGDFH